VAVVGRGAPSGVQLKLRRQSWLASLTARVASNPMPDMPPPAMNPAAPPPGGAGAPPTSPGVGGGAPGQPPFGSSPVSQPVPNRGQEAAGLSRLAVVVRLMEETVPLLGVGSEPGQAVLKALNSLAKHVPPGSVPPGVQTSTMQRLLSQQQQNAPQVAAMRAMQAGPQAPAGGGAPPAPPAPPAA